ncbi:hypothetical protein ACVWW2_003243 [Bradyrhizobium sp. LM4.3]
MLAVPIVDCRISRRWASSPLKKRAGFSVIGRLQDTAHEQRFRLMRIKFELPGCGIHRQLRRARVEMQACGALGVIKTAVVEQHVGRAQQPARANAATRTPLAANLEQIGEIIVEQQGQPEIGRAVAVVLHADALIGGAAPQEDRAHDVEQVLLQHEAALPVDIRIGEIDRQRRVVVAQVGSQQQRLEIVEHELKPRKVARVVMEQAVGPAGRGADVAMAVKHDKGIVVLERTPRPRRRSRHRNIERLLRDLVHGSRHGDELSNGFSRHQQLPCACFDTQPTRTRLLVYAAACASRLISCVTSSR